MCMCVYASASACACGCGACTCAYVYASTHSTHSKHIHSLSLSSRSHTVCALSAEFFGVCVSYTPIHSYSPPPVSFFLFLSVSLSCCGRYRVWWPRLQRQEPREKYCAIIITEKGSYPWSNEWSIIYNQGSGNPDCRDKSGDKGRDNSRDKGRPKNTVLS